MRCECCDRGLNDYESTIRSKSTGDYTNMCLRCLSETGIQFQGRSDLAPFASNEEIDEDYFQEDDHEGNETDGDA